MGPPSWSFAPDAHDCIMVWILGSAEYKPAARRFAPFDELPLECVDSALYQLLVFATGALDSRSGRLQGYRRAE
jgi:hypothetical protein